MQKQLLVLVAMMSLAAACAQASTVSYTQALAPNPSMTDISTTLDLPRFSPSLGTLTGVQITVNGSLTASAGYEYRGTAGLAASQSRMRVDLTQNLKVALDGQVLLTMSHLTAHDYYNANYVFLPDYDGWVQNIPADALTAFDGTVDFGGTSGFTTKLWDVKDSATYTPASIDTFVGAGTFPVSVDATAYALLSSSGGSNSTMTSSLAGTSVTVEYTYTPEPASLSLLALGGLAVMRRKQK